jgi:hypothetical protein
METEIKIKIFSYERKKSAIIFFFTLIIVIVTILDIYLQKHTHFTTTTAGLHSVWFWIIIHKQVFSIYQFR